MLKRDISGVNILIAAAGGMIGSGWLFSPLISAQMAGSNALLSWVISASFMLLIALPLCELGAMLPISGGMTNYPSMTHGKDVGFLFAWISWLSYVVMTPIEIQAILQYSSYFFPFLIEEHSKGLVLSTYGYFVAMGIMLCVVLLNSYGIRFLAECNKFASIIKFLIPSLLIICFFSKASSWEQGFQIQLTNEQDWIAVLSTLSGAGVIFAFNGFQNGLMLAGEVKNPQKNIPIAILGAVVVGFVLYFLLQLSFLVAVPKSLLTEGWSHLSFHGEHGPLVALSLMLGLKLLAHLLLFDAALSPFGTTLVYTAVTSRILYSMSLNDYLPKVLTRVNRYGIPYLTLWLNFAVGVLSFLPFPGWQSMVAFLSSCSVLSYGVGPLCLMGLRALKPEMERPFRLFASRWICYGSFYVCNLMLYWCGFDILFKLNLALLFGLLIHVVFQKKTPSFPGVIWFFSYMGSLLLVSYFGSFGGIGKLDFPLDLVLLFFLSLGVFYTSQKCLIYDETLCETSSCTL